MIFSIPEVTNTIEISNANEERSILNSFLTELFGDQTHSPDASSWLLIVLETTKSDVRSGLKEEFKNNLITKYEPKEELSFLTPPKVNREILSNLGATVITHDKYQMQS